MFILRKSFTYILLITIIGAYATYTIVVKAYDGIDANYTEMLSQ